jgi:hypothetical protein
MARWTDSMKVVVLIGTLLFLSSIMWDLKRDDGVVLRVPSIRSSSLFSESSQYVVVPYGVTVRRVLVDVDYDVPVSRLISLGKYDAAHDGYTDAKFPIEEHGRKKVDVYLLQFDRKISGNEVWERTRKLGFYSASVFELLTLGAQYPDVQRSGPIFCLGYEHDNAVPFLSVVSNGSKRIAWILRAKRDYVYPKDAWFAVVKLDDTKLEK